MASTKRDFYIVDLIREDRKNFVFLNQVSEGGQIPPIRVNVTIEVAADVPKAKMDRLEKAARESIDKTEEIVTGILAQHEKKTADFVAKQMWKEAMTAAEQVTPLIKNAAVLAQSNALAAVEKAKKAEAQGDKLLIEARVKVTITFIFSGVKVITNIARIGASHGGDVHAWLSLGKEVIKIGMEIHQQLKDEPRLRKDLIDGIGAYLELRSTTVMSVATKYGLTGKLPGFPEVIVFVAEGALNTAKDLTKGKDKTAVVKDVGNFIVKGITVKFNDVEKARKAYREQTTKMRQKVDDVSAKGDKLFAEMKKQTTLKEGVKIGAQCMQVRSKATKLSKALEDAVGFLDASQTTMEQFGLKCDDSTILQKIKALDTSTIFSEGSSIVENVMAIKDLVDAVS